MSQKAYIEFLIIGGKFNEHYIREECKNNEDIIGSFNALKESEKRTVQFIQKEWKIEDGECVENDSIILSNFEDRKIQLLPFPN